MHEQIWTVLVVEDDGETRESICDALTVEGFAALNARNGIEALRVLEGYPGKCLILLDLGLPEMDGETFLRSALEFRNSVSRFPVVVVSGAPDLEFSRKLPLVVGVVQKPIELKNLMAVVKEHVAPIGRPLR